MIKERNHNGNNLLTKNKKNELNKIRKNKRQRKKLKIKI